MVANLRSTARPAPCALATVSVVLLPKMHPHMLRHTHVTTPLNASLDLHDVHIIASHADPERPRATTEPEPTSTATPTTSTPPTSPAAPEHAVLPMIGCVILDR
jgi:hypothetical protein